MSSVIELKARRIVDEFSRYNDISSGSDYVPSDDEEDEKKPQVKRKLMKRKAKTEANAVLKEVAKIKK